MWAAVPLGGALRDIPKNGCEGDYGFRWNLTQCTSVDLQPSHIPPRCSALFVEPTWASSLSFDFQIWYPNRWVYPWCSSVKGRFEHVNECNEICESATNRLGRELFTLRLIIIWRDCSFLVNILAIAVQWFDCDPASLVFFSSGTPPPALTHWKCFKTASNTVKQKKNTTGKQDKTVLFKKH